MTGWETGGKWGREWGGEVGVGRDVGGVGELF